MAKAKTAVSAKVFAQLVDMAQVVLGEFSHGFADRATDDRDEFFENINDESQWLTHMQFGQLYAGDDYTWRVLMAPKHRAAMVAEFERVQAYRNANPDASAAPLPDLAVAIKLASDVLNTVAEQEPADRCIGADDGDGFFHEFICEIFAFYDFGEVSDRS